MNKFSIGSACWVLATLVCFVSCTKNDSKFYEDGDADGLAIFSNRGNNVMSCYINGEAWQTRSRLTTIALLGSNTHYEVYLYRNRVSNTLETVQINWQGYYQKDKLTSGFVGLQLSIPFNSFQRYLNGLQGQRIRIDSSTGNYFTAATGFPIGVNPKANGSIYFQTIQIDSTATGIYTGKMSGLFEADFGSGTITKGRFDHVLTGEQIR